MHVSDQLTWLVTWPKKRGAVRRFFGAAMHVTDTGLSPASGAARTSVTPLPATTDDVTLPEERSAEIPLERLVAEDPDGELRDVVLTQEDATVEGLPGVRLREAVIVDAVSRAEDDPHRADAHWELAVEVSDTRFTLYGP